jgi:hypothetical protein
MIIPPDPRDNAPPASGKVQRPRWSKRRLRPSRFFLVIGLLLLTAPRSPAPVSERLPLFKRTFFTLKGHAVDTFANEKKLPPELAPEFTHASVLATKPLTELTELMAKFGHVASYPPTVLTAGADGEEQTPEMQRREAAFQKIAKSQLKKIAANPILPMAAGLGSNITFSASELPSAFFADSAWDIETAQPEDLLTKGVKRPNRTRIEIPLWGAELFRYATKKDIEIMRRTHRESALLRFYSEACRGGAPRRLLPLRVTAFACGDGGAVVTAEPPPLQIRVVVLENIQDTAIELGQFHFRMLDPGRGILTVRTRAENETLLATMNADSEVWYKPRVVKPGEKVIVPLELLLKPSRSPSQTEPAATRAGRRACANKLLADRELQTVALMDLSNDIRAPNSVPLVVMPKQKFVDALLREAAAAPEKEEFVYGPSIALDSVDVNGFRSQIEPFDPINVAYFSGFSEGSCPFVYSRHTTEGAWLKQGTILTGRSSKAREGTGVLQIHAFDGTLRISEEEGEISYIDELFVRGTLANGERVTLRPTDERIAHKDLRYLELKKGDSVEIKFSVPNDMRGDAAEVVASGFFELLPAPAGQ